MELNLFESLLQQLPPAIEWWAVGLSVVYVILAARNSVWCWPFAFISSCLWAWQVWFAYNLLFDAGLNVFYAIMAIWGLWLWWRTDGTIEEKPITTLTGKQHLMLIGFGVSLSILLGYIAAVTTTAAMSYLDALTTVFSVMATFMLIERKIENWIYLLVMDLIYIYLYVQRGSLIFAALFAVFCVLAVVGYFSWKKIHRTHIAQL